MVCSGNRTEGLRLQIILPSSLLSKPGEAVPHPLYVSVCRFILLPGPSNTLAPVRQTICGLLRTCGWQHRIARYTNLGQALPPNAVRQTTQYGPIILVTLWDDPTTNIRVFLPKRFAEVFLDSDIESINNGTRVYHLISHGRTPNGRSFRLSLEE